MFYWGAVNKLRHKNIKVDFQKKRVHEVLASEQLKV